MKVKIILPLLFIIVIIGLSFVFIVVKTNTSNYSVIIESYKDNGSYIEYPKISGLKNESKQKIINKLLKEQIFVGAKNYNNKPFVDFSHKNYRFEFRNTIGYYNNDIASFKYSFNGYGQVKYEDGGIMRNTYRSYGITLNMLTGEKINLTDFMIVDDRLINSNDGNNKEHDYNSQINLQHHNFKDAFMIYTTEDEKDSYHMFTPEEIVSSLKNNEQETNWYIDENKNIVFYFDKNYIKIPYTELSEIIYPYYYDMLNK